jgi:hypothetical protein
LKKKQLPSPIGLSMVKVGDIKAYTSSKDSKTGKLVRKKILYNYQDVQYDIDGWVDSKKYLPEDFDLVYMRLKREKVIPGWISGTSWLGLRLKPDDEVTFWKRKVWGED